MNTGQRICVMLTLAFGVLMALFPPMTREMVVPGSFGHRHADGTLRMQAPISTTIPGVTIPARGPDSPGGPSKEIAIQPQKVFDFSTWEATPPRRFLVTEYQFVALALQRTVSPPDPRSRHSSGQNRMTVIKQSAGDPLYRIRFGLLFVQWLVLFVVWLVAHTLVGRIGARQS